MISPNIYFSDILGTGVFSRLPGKVLGIYEKQPLCHKLIKNRTLSDFTVTGNPEE